MPSSDTGGFNAEVSGFREVAIKQQKKIYLITKMIKQSFSFEEASSSTALGTTYSTLKFFPV